MKLVYLVALLCILLTAGCVANTSTDIPVQSEKTVEKEVPAQINCPIGTILGSDNLCHQECGTGFYCTDGSSCINDQCVKCDDGLILGSDEKCHEPCEDSTTYCINDAVCYNNKCVDPNSIYKRVVITGVDKYQEIGGGDPTIVIITGVNITAKILGTANINTITITGQDNILEIPNGKSYNIVDTGVKTEIKYY